MLRRLQHTVLAALIALGGVGLSTAEQAEIIALKKRYIAIDAPLGAAQDRAYAKLADSYFRMLTGIDTAEAKKEMERFRAARSEPREISPDPKVAAAQERLAMALENFDSLHPERRSGLAAEYLRRLELAGEPAAAVASERGRLEKTLGRKLDRSGGLNSEPWGDTYVRSGAFAEQPFGDAEVLGVGGSDQESGAFTDDHRIAYLRFDLTTLPKTINDARLMLRVAEHDAEPGATHVLSASSQRQPWDEDVSTYNGHAAAIRKLAKWQAPIANRAIVYIDLTEELRERRRQGIDDLDVRIHCAAGPAYVGYGSREHADASLRPRLLINDPGVGFGSVGGEGPQVEVLLPKGATAHPPPRSGDDRRRPRRDPPRRMRDDRERRPPAPIVNVPSAIATGAPEKDLPLAASLAQVKALLIRELPGGEVAGFGQTFTATAVKSGGDGAMDITFSGDVGDMMQTALVAVARGLQVKYGAWPHGYAMRLSFQEKYAPKDGPSAAVACGLLIDGLVTGAKYDPKFAVTGDLNSDLSVQPIGGVPAKLRGAKASGATIVAVPAANARALDDMVVLGDLAALAELQIFTIERFEQARDLALAERPLKLQVAIDKFAKLQQAGLAGMRGESGIATLREIVALAPHHASAAQILRAAEGKAPRTLSLAGSFITIDETMAPFVAAIGSGQAKSIADSQYAAAMERLQLVKKKLDPRTTKLHTNLVDLLIFVRRQIDKTFGNVGQYRAALAEADVLLKRLEAERKRLAADPEIVEELSR